MCVHENYTVALPPGVEEKPSEKLNENLGYNFLPFHRIRNHHLYTKANSLKDTSKDYLRFINSTKKIIFVITNFFRLNYRQTYKHFFSKQKNLSLIDHYKKSAAYLGIHVDATTGREIFFDHFADRRSWKSIFAFYRDKRSLKSRWTTSGLADKAKVLKGITNIYKLGVYSVSALSTGYQYYLTPQNERDAFIEKHLKLKPLKSKEQSGFRNKFKAYMQFYRDNSLLGKEETLANKAIEAEDLLYQANNLLWDTYYLPPNLYQSFKNPKHQSSTKVVKTYGLSAADFINNACGIIYDSVWFAGTSAASATLSVDETLEENGVKNQTYSYSYQWIVAIQTLRSSGIDVHFLTKTFSTPEFSQNANNLQKVFHACKEITKLEAQRGQFANNAKKVAEITRQICRQNNTIMRQLGVLKQNIRMDSYQNVSASKNHLLKATRTLYEHYVQGKMTDQSHQLSRFHRYRLQFYQQMQSVYRGWKASPKSIFRPGLLSRLTARLAPNFSYWGQVFRLRFGHVFRNIRQFVIPTEGIKFYFSNIGRYYTTSGIHQFFVNMRHSCASMAKNVFIGGVTLTALKTYANGVITKIASYGKAGTGGLYALSFLAGFVPTRILLNKTRWGKSYMNFMERNFHEHVTHRFLTRPIATAYINCKQSLSKWWNVPKSYKQTIHIQDRIMGKTLIGTYTAPTPDGIMSKNSYKAYAERNAEVIYSVQEFAKKVNPEKFKFIYPMSDVDIMVPINFGNRIVRASLEELKNIEFPLYFDLKTGLENNKEHAKLHSFLKQSRKHHYTRKALPCTDWEVASFYESNYPKIFRPDWTKHYKNKNLVFNDGKWWVTQSCVKIDSPFKSEYQSLILQRKKKYANRKNYAQKRLQNILTTVNLKQFNSAQEQYIKKRKRKKWGKVTHQGQGVIELNRYIPSLNRKKPPLKNDTLQNLRKLLPENDLLKKHYVPLKN